MIKHCVNEVTINNDLTPCHPFAGNRTLKQRYYHHVLHLGEPKVNRSRVSKNCSFSVKHGQGFLVSKGVLHRLIELITITPHLSNTLVQNISIYFGKLTKPSINPSDQKFLKVNYSTRSRKVRFNYIMQNIFVFMTII